MSEADMNTGPAPAGWYRAPDDPALVRYWDGEIWTERARPGPNSSTGPGTTGVPDASVQSAKPVRALLEDGERIEAGFGGAAPLRHGYMAATDRRVLIVKPSRFRKHTSHSYDYDEVSAVGMSGVNAVVIMANGERHKIELLAGTSPALENFVSFVRHRISRGDTDADLSAMAGPTAPTTGHESAQAEPAHVEPANPLLGVADELHKLADLRDQGILTEAEFAAQKAKLLA